MSLILRGERPDLLVGAEGQPMPPASALVALANIDERLSMRFFPIAVQAGDMEDPGGCWCFTEAWGEHDVRWASVVNGDVARDKTYDIIGWAPRNMLAEDALGYLLRALEKGAGTKHEAHAYIERIQEHTRALRAATIAQGTEDAIESVIEGMQL